MEIRREIKQINCYAGQNRPAWIVIHETDNYKMVPVPLNTPKPIETATCPPLCIGM